MYNKIVPFEKIDGLDSDLQFACTQYIVYALCVQLFLNVLGFRLLSRQRIEIAGKQKVGEGCVAGLQIPQSLSSANTVYLSVVRNSISDRTRTNANFNRISFYPFFFRFILKCVTVRFLIAWYKKTISK